MGAGLLACSPAARHLFEEADRATDLPLTRLCLEGPADRLTDTAHAQPGVVAVSLAAAAALQERLSETGATDDPDHDALHAVLHEARECSGAVARERAKMSGRFW